MNRSPLCHLLHWNCRTAVLSVDKAIRMAFHFRSFTPFSRSFEHSHTHTYTHVSLDTSQFYSSYCYKKFELCMLDVMVVKMVMELSNLVQPLNAMFYGMKRNIFYGRKQQQTDARVSSCSHNIHNFRTFHFWPLALVSRKKYYHKHIKQVTFLPRFTILYLFILYSLRILFAPSSTSFFFLVCILMAGILLFVVIALKRRK